MMRVINISFYTVFIALMLGIGGLLVASMLPIPGNIELKIVKSGSMEPQIPTGSLVVVRPEISYAVGDVITFGKDTKTDIPTTHRIIEITSEGGQIAYRTKGDANEDPEPNLAPRSDVIGKVIFHTPGVGYVLAFARTPMGFAMLIGVPAALVILEELFAIVKEVRNAVRRRKGKRDDHPQGGSLTGQGSMHESGAPLRLVYLRKRAMDEIFVPMFVEPAIFHRKWWHDNVFMHKDAYGTATFVVVGLIATSGMMAGGASGTLSYFNDVERSLGNIFRAGQGWEVPVLPDEPGPTFSLSTLSLGAPEGEVLGESTDTPPEEPEADPPPEDTSPPETTPEPESTQTPANESISPLPSESIPAPDEPEPESGSQSGNTQDSPVQEETPLPSDPSADPAPETLASDVVPPVTDSQ